MINWKTFDEKFDNNNNMVIIDGGGSIWSFEEMNNWLIDNPKTDTKSWKWVYLDELQSIPE